MDKISSSARSANMSKIRSRGTAPEFRVRKLAHRMGYRFRLHRKDLPGKPDLVFPGRTAVIFVHGCFWHQHPEPDCLDGRRPKSRREYWDPKLDRNIERDAKSVRALQELGWRVLVLWECETKDAASLKERLRVFLGPIAARG